MLTFYVGVSGLSEVEAKDIITAGFQAIEQDCREEIKKSKNEQDASRIQDKEHYNHASGVP